MAAISILIIGMHDRDRGDAIDADSSRRSRFACSSSSTLLKGVQNLFVTVQVINNHTDQFHLDLMRKSTNSKQVQEIGV